MVAARSAAMGFNRLVDARIDALNPAHGDARDTARRDEPRAKRPSSSSCRRSSSCSRRGCLSPLCGLLSPVALAIVFWYSLAKRYTILHAGVSRPGDGGGAGRRLAGGRRPSAAGSRGCWALAIGLWVGGFDILYACQDDAFDRAHGLQSIPVRFGIARSLLISRVMHVGDRRVHGGAGVVVPLGPIYLAGVALVAALLIYEQSLVSEERSVAGEARVRSQRLRRHPVFRDDGARGLCRLTVRGYDTKLDKSPATIAGMFDAIAGRYDLLNTVLSGGLDRYWRRRAIASLQLTGREAAARRLHRHGDVAIGAARRGAARRVVGVDFAGAMLTHGLDKVRTQALGARVQLVRGDAMSLPVASESVDGATIAFGIRNVAAARGRVPRTVPRAAARRPARDLEFGTAGRGCSAPSISGIPAHVLPRIGRAVSRHDAAYTYLPASVGAFPGATRSRES